MGRRRKTIPGTGFMQRFSAAVYELRLRRGLTQGQLAELLGVSRGQVGNLEGGRVWTGAETFDALLGLGLMLQNPEAQAAAQGQLLDAEREQRRRLEEQLQEANERLWALTVVLSGRRFVRAVLREGKTEEQEMLARQRCAADVEG